jgi:hypothetical protein
VSSKDFEGESIVNEDRDAKSQGRWMEAKAWFYVCGLALLFLIYGLFMFYMIGDKGPPGWDFGTMEDVPGQSVYSTLPGAPGTIPEPEPQHVSGRPPLAPAGPGTEKP